MKRLILLLTALQVIGAHGYDALQIPEKKITPILTEFTDEARQRELPLAIYLPHTKQPAPVIIFSHGLGGSREGSSFLASHWAARGYAVVCVQHPGSDEAVWKDQPQNERAAAMRAAANVKNFLLRTKDIPATLDVLTTWNEKKGHALFSRLDLDKVGMAGHSFGAITAQALSGQATQDGKARFADPRIDAALILSPGMPKLGTAEVAFGKVKLPWLLMTGTKDVAQIGALKLGPEKAEIRRAVFPALAPGGKYQLVLHEGEHFIFNDSKTLDTPAEAAQRQSIKLLSTAFWDAWISNKKTAREWIDGPNVIKQLGQKDLWEKR